MKELEELREWRIEHPRYDPKDVALADRMYGAFDKRLTALEETPIPEAKAWLKCLDRLTALENWRDEYDELGEECNPTCGGCKHSLELDAYDDLLCLLMSASVYRPYFIDGHGPACEENFEAVK